jgi:trk system potassium uptake protein
MSIEEQSMVKMEGLVFRIPRVRALRMPFMIPKPTTPLSSILFLVYGFAALIILGTGLLMLPMSSSSGHFTSPINALFTATSAVCVTGLVVVDTGTYWSAFGQGVLLALFQIGGLGFITGATLLLLAINRRFGLKERLAITETIGVDQLGGAIGIVIKLALFSLVVEGIGAVIFYFYGITSGNTSAPLWTAIFHSVSAFNNCGMDIMGNFKSLLGFQGDALFLFVTALMIIIGSTGYIVIADYIMHRTFSRLTLDSKIVLVTTLALLALGTIFYLAAESSNPATMGPLSFPQKILVAFFQAVAPRTAGFSAVDIGSLRAITLLFTMFLMFVGGATGSTAGGIKVNTLGTLAIAVKSLLSGTNNIEAFGRQLRHQTVYRAMALFLLYLVITGIIVMALSITEVFPIDKLLFETFSALSTVGLSTGITPDLSSAGRIIIIFAMFIGRLGPLAFMAILIHREKPTDVEYPHEAIRLG